MIVVDASALITMLVYADARGLRAREALATDVEWAAPEHWKAEVFSAIRGLVLGGHLSDTAGRRALARIPRLVVDHVGLDGLMSRMWDMRDTISGYDVAYVALAEQRRLTLVTADSRLARAATRYCRVQLIA